MNRHIKLNSGLFIPQETLRKVNINSEEVDVELWKEEIRIRPIKRRIRKKLFAHDSPLLKCVGSAKVKGASGKNHDKYLYEK